MPNDSPGNEEKVVPSPTQPIARIFQETLMPLSVMRMKMLDAQSRGVFDKNAMMAYVEALNDVIPGDDIQDRPEWKALGPLPTFSIKFTEKDYLARSKVIRKIAAEYELVKREWKAERPDVNAPTVHTLEEMLKK